MAGLREVDADLVRAACFQTALDEREVMAEVFQRLDVRDRLLAVVAFSGAPAAVAAVANELAADRTGVDAADADRHVAAVGGVGAKLLSENPVLEEIMRNARNETEALVGVKNWVLEELKKNPDAYQFYKKKVKGREFLEKLKWNDFAAIRLLDYIDHAGREFEDQNLRGEMAISNPITLIWLAVNYGTGGAKPYFFMDMLHQ